MELITTKTSSSKSSVSQKISSLLASYEKAMDWAGQHEKIVLPSAFIVALLVRVLYMLLFVGLDSPPMFDGIGYHNLAANLMQGKGYVREDGLPTAFRPPTFSIFLVAIYSLFGFNYSVGRLAQAIMSSLTCLVIYALGKKLFSQRSGMIALAGVVIYPLFIYMTGEFFPDTVALLPAMLALLLAVYMLENDLLGLPISLGIFLGITITLRTTYSLLLPFLLLWCFVVFRLKRAMVNVTLILSGLMLILAPWIARNYITFGEFIPLGSNSGVSLWAGNNPIAEGRGTPVLPGSWEGPDPPDLGWDGWSGVSETEISHRFFQAGSNWIRQHPNDFLSLIPRKMIYAWSPVSYGVAYSRQVSSRVILLVVPLYLIILCFALVGAWAYRVQWKKLGPLYCTMLAVTCTAMIFYGATRHAMLMHPSILLLSAAGLSTQIDALAVAINQPTGERSA